MTLKEIKKVTQGFNGMVRVQIPLRMGAYWFNISEFTDQEAEQYEVVKVVGTEYPSVYNVIEITVK